MAERTVSQPLKSIKHHRVTWNLYNFLNGPLDGNKKIESPEFVINLPKPIKCRLSLTGMEKYNTNFSTAIAVQRFASLSAIRPRVEIRHPEVHSNKDFSTRTDSAPNDKSEIGKCVVLRSIMCYKGSQSNNPSNFKVTFDFLLDIPKYFQELVTDADLKNLSNELGLFYALGNFTNLDLKVGCESFPVHRAIVKARSPFVAGKLREDPTLRQIDLPNFDPSDQIKGLIVYWYSGDMDKIDMTPSSTTSDFMRNIGQEDIRPYVDHKNIIISTTKETFKRLISWYINDSDFCKNIKKFETDIFSEYTFKEHSWILYFYPKGNAIRTGKADHISLCVKEVGETIGLHSADVEIFFEDEDGEEYGCKKATSYLHQPGKYHFPNFMSHSEFSGLQRTLLKNDILRIGCRIIYGTGSVKNELETFEDSEVETIQHPYRVLSNALTNLLQSEDMSDITLRARGRTFKVHREILAARSGYFHWLLSKPEYKTLENADMELNDIEPDDLDAILKYMYYAEKIELNLERALRLYPTFHIYKIQRLMSLCSEYLQSHLTIGNAFPFIEVANKFKDESLKTAALEIIRANWNQM